MKHDSLLLRNHWYIACASLLLEQEPLAAQVLDQPLMLFRDAAGVPHALLDRCSHRGLPLSMGQVIDGTVACAYHGWRFDGSGACVHIPSLVEGRHIPAGCKVPAFACREHDGYVWVWMGEDAGALSPCPRVPDFARLAWTQGTSLWQCAAERALENFFDWCHPAFAHRASRHPQAVRVEEEGFRETAYEMRLLPDGMLVFAPPLPVPVRLPEAGLPGGPEPGEEEAAIADHATVVSRFQLPCRATMQRPRAGVRVVLHFIATGPGSCRVEWLTHHAGLGDQPGVTWAEQENLILEEDRVILEASQPWYDAGDTSFECSVEADAVTLMLRRVLALARHGRWAAEWEGLRQRRVVRVRT